MSWRKQALERWYYSQPGWISGSDDYRKWIASNAQKEGLCLEIGPGPGGKTSRCLAEHFECVEGLDIDPSIDQNKSLSKVFIYDGQAFPMESERYNCIVSDYVAEHVEFPAVLLSEANRVLKPGGRFFFRTPNLWHYVSLIAKLTPHSFHLSVSHRLRNMDSDSHDVYPTFYRMNTRRCLHQLAQEAGLDVIKLRMIEKEPSYGLISPLLFYPFMLYERIVNSSQLFEGARANIFGILEKRSS